jgi:hypothetical protein
MGVLFARGKGLDLIAGYNTLSPREKEKYDKEKLCKAMSKMVFLLAATWAVAALGAALHWNALCWTGIALFLAVIIGGVIYMNTGNQCKK